MSSCAISRNVYKNNVEVSNSVCYNSITFADTLVSTKVEETNHFADFINATSKALEPLDEIECQEPLDFKYNSSLSFSRKADVQ